MDETTCRHCSKPIHQDTDGGELYWTHDEGFVACFSSYGGPDAEPAEAA